MQGAYKSDATSLISVAAGRIAWRKKQGRPTCTVERPVFERCCQPEHEQLPASRLRQVPPITAWINIDSDQA